MPVTQYPPQMKFLPDRQFHYNGTNNTRHHTTCIIHIKIVSCRSNDPSPRRYKSRPITPKLTTHHTTTPHNPTTSATNSHYTDISASPQLPHTQAKYNTTTREHNNAHSENQRHRDQRDGILPRRHSRNRIRTIPMVRVRKDCSPQFDWDRLESTF